MYKRQGHIAPKPIQPQSRPLNIILEEDESRSSSPSSCYSDNSSNMSVKARRRHATVSASHLRLSRVFPDDDTFLSSPRPAPQPQSPASPDSFKLTFTDISFKFPHPPIPTPTSMRKYHRQTECDSPTSSLSSSPCSQMPLTPSTSDDESGPSPSRRPLIQPLVITKHNPRHPSIFDDDYPISPSLLQPFKTPSENPTPLSPLSSSYLPEKFFYDSDEDSEPESDSEWYGRELSKTISLRSPIPPSSPIQTSVRPDSISTISTADISTITSRPVSKPLPPTPLSGGFPSAQLDPTFPRRRNSKRRSLPKYPPPPIPTLPSSSPSPSPTSSSSFASASRRPPPRSSIPADCIYDLAEVEDVPDSSSTFSFSIYDVYLGGEPISSKPASLPSSYSQSSFEDPINSVTFELDCPIMLPLSLPTTPFDLEADIAHGLEQLRVPPVDVQPSVVPEIREAEQQVVAEPPQQQQQQQQQVFDDIFSSPFSPTFPSSPAAPSSLPYLNEEKTLKSKWSSSTLGSIREEHESRGASAKLRLYFTGHSSPPKTNKRTSKKSSTTPVSPLTYRGKKNTSTVPVSPPSPTSASKASRAHVRAYSDVLVIGYGNNGVRRRGSVTNSVSDAGSEESCSSTSSSGLRRKPIPVEMFLRGAV